MEASDVDWFYVESFSKGMVTLGAEESRHLKVKRHYADQMIAVFDGKGKVGIGTVVDTETLNVEELKEFSKESSLTIATAVPKGDKFDFLLQKLTELNVSVIIPMKTKHSVVLPNNVERYKRILIEACKQCKRPWLPEIKSLTEFSNVLKEKADVKLILDKHGEKVGDVSKKKILVLIGPEGGFTEEELEEAENAGFVMTSVGKNILRIETAAVAVAAIISSNNL